MKTAPMPEQLRAKSPSHRFGELTLEQHLCDTESAARAIFVPEQRVTKNYLRFFRIEEQQELFLRTLRVAALFHDIGKANECFFNMVSGKSREQVLRHEHFSGLVLCLPEVKKWLCAKPGAVDYDAVCAAVLSHHTKISKPGGTREEHSWCATEGTFSHYLQHIEVQKTLERVKDIAGLAFVPSLPKELWSSHTEDSCWLRALGFGKKDADGFAAYLRKSASDQHRKRNLVLAVKAALVACDSVASAAFREGLDLQQWVQETLHREPLSDRLVWTDVIEKRVESVRQKKGSFTWQNFQEGAGEQPSRTLLLAACGAGKTLAAWRWIAKQCAARSVGRVVFLYPTRGTATEGFRDYVGWAPEGDATLASGTSKYELDALAQNPNDATRNKNYVDESAERLFALGLWSKRYFSATVDQFLGFMEHSYRGLCLLPILSDAVVVLDEVHSYDRRLFDNAESFLSNFDVPVLAMTATLAPARQQKLVAAGLSVYPKETDRSDLQELEANETHPRYELVKLSGEEAALAECLAAKEDGKRVLWVVNTVARAQRIARFLEQQLKAKVRCYHSRFKLQDRQDAHAETIKLFQGNTSACIAVTTQVCEMSLDLDAHVLLTEIAPLSSLVQRMGRANRNGRPGETFRARVCVYEPERVAPYTREEIQTTRKALQELTGEPAVCSQRRLAELLETYAPPETKSADACAFLRGGWFAVPGSLREEDEHAMQCVLDEDIPAVKKAYEQKAAIDGWLVPVPRKAVKKESAESEGLPKWIGIAAEEQYDPWYGFEVES